MSNRRKTTRTKLPKPSEAEAIRAYQQAHLADDTVVVPTHLPRRALRAMRQRVPVMQVLQPALDWAAKQPAHQHDPSCSHYRPKADA